MSRRSGPGQSTFSPSPNADGAVSPTTRSPRKRRWIPPPRLRGAPRPDPRIPNPAGSRPGIGAPRPRERLPPRPPETRGTARSRPHGGRYPRPVEEYAVLMLDPPDHTRLHGPVTKAFTLRAVAALESRIPGIWWHSSARSRVPPLSISWNPSYTHPPKCRRFRRHRCPSPRWTTPAWPAGPARSGPMRRPKPRSGGENASTGGLGAGVPPGKGALVRARGDTRHAAGPARGR